MPRPAPRTTASAPPRAAQEFGEAAPPQVPRALTVTGKPMNVHSHTDEGLSLAQLASECVGERDGERDPTIDGELYDLVNAAGFPPRQFTYSLEESDNDGSAICEQFDMDESSIVLESEPDDYTCVDLQHTDA